jgi:cell division transport system permease protein
MRPLDRALRGAKNDFKLYGLGVFSAAVAFVCLAAAVVVNVDGVRARWADAGRASVFLKSDAGAERAAALEEALGKTPGVHSVRRVTSEEARREIVLDGSDPLLDALPVDAFPASLELELEAGLSRVRLEKLKAQLAALPAVETVQTYDAWSERLAALLGAGLSVSLLVAAVVLAAVASVVSSTIRLSLERRRLEVEVLKLVGASDEYVRRPFVMEGAAQGALGALAAIVLLSLLFGIARAQVDPVLVALVGVTPSFLPWWMMLLFVLVGGGLGAGSAHLSLRRLIAT